MVLGQEGGKPSGKGLVNHPIYVSINVAYFYVLTPGEVASIPASSSAATEVVRRFLGGAATRLMAGAMATSIFGTLLIATLVCARIPYAMARDGLFFRRPRPIDAAHARTGTRAVGPGSVGRHTGALWVIRRADGLRDLRHAKLRRAGHLLGLRLPREDANGGAPIPDLGLSCSASTVSTGGRVAHCKHRGGNTEAGSCGAGTDDAGATVLLVLVKP